MDEQCGLFGLFGWVVQLFLGFLCFCSLVCKLKIVKRYQEEPRRPWDIFLLVKAIQDTSKQAFSAGMAHVLNLMAAVIVSKWASDNPCVWYFINLLIDTTVGVVLAYALLMTFEYIARRNEWITLISGKYADGEDIDLGSWSLQLMIWATIVLIVKAFLLYMMSMFAHLLSEMGHYVLRPLEHDPHMELIVVMVIIPLMLNIIQFWVQDNFLKTTPEDFSPRVSLEGPPKQDFQFMQVLQIFKAKDGKI